MKLAYRAFDKSGNAVADTIEAANPVEAGEQLRRQGLYVTGIAEAAAAPKAGRGRRRRQGRGRKLKNLTMFLRQLHVLVSSGTPLVQALSALERQTRDGRWREVIEDIRNQVEEGAGLAEAMDARPDCFDSVTRGLIAAGESGGNLMPMLDRLAALTRNRLHIRNALVGALIYPCLLVGVALIVLGVLMTFVIPRFGELFETLDLPLPATTEALLTLSAFLRSYWWALLSVVVAGAVGLKLYMGSAAGKRAFDTLVLRLPQIGRITRSFTTARIARLLGVLMESHVPVLEALQLTRQATGNTHYANLLGQAQNAVTQGEPISTAFADADLVSPSVHEAIRNGEQSGKVGPLLVNIAQFLDEENETVVRSLTSILEPVILVLLGLVVGVVAISMFLPLFDLTSMIAGG